MYKHWKKIADSNIKSRVFDTLKNNVDHYKQIVLGIPAP